jgi:Lar family restriction alleviation protein
MENELKPCPFCGCKAVDIVEDDNIYLHLRYQVFCGRCGASSGRHHTKQKAIEAWNRRYRDGT